MILELGGKKIDLNDELDCHYWHHYIMHKRYHLIQEQGGIEGAKALSDLTPVMKQFFNEGPESFRNKYQLYPNRKVDWEDEDRNILHIKKG